MKNITIKTLLIVLAILLTISMVACKDKSVQETSSPSASDADESTNIVSEQSTEPTPSEPITITMIMAGGNTPSTDNDVIQEVMKRTGYDMDVTYVAGADYETKLSAMIASETLPDIFKFDITSGEEFRDNGMILELTELLTEYGSNILADKGELNTGLNAGEGIWGIPYGYLYPSNLSIRTDWLETLALDMPTDLDSLYQVLQAFTNDDPNQNGKNDTIGIACMTDIMRTFTYIFGAYDIPVETPIQLSDGTVTTYMRHPNYLEAIKYIRKLYQEGLMNKDFATIPRLNCHELLWNGVAGMYDFQSVGTTNNWLGRYTEDTVPTFDFAVIEGPESSGGCVEPRQTDYWGISSLCKYPEDAVMLANYLTGEEGDELLYFGVEGVHYNWLDKEEGTYEYIPPYDDSATHRNAGGYVYWLYFIPDNNNAEIRTLNSLTRKGLEISRSNYVPDAYIYSALATDKEYGSTLNDIVKESFAQLIVSNGDIEAEYQNFVERWLSEGGEAWQEEATEVYAQENND